jgi:hypothetical protein
VHGQFTDAELSSPNSTLRFAISSNLSMVGARDNKSEPPQFITQTLEAGGAVRPERLALVLDGSEEMTPFFPKVARALEGYPATPDLAIWFSHEGVRQVYRKDWKSPESASTAVGRLRGIGDKTICRRCWRHGNGPAGGRNDRLVAGANQWSWAALKR